MGNSKDKENHAADTENTLDKFEKVYNRRDSLGRGILKNRKDENNTVALPLRDAKIGRLSLGGAREMNLKRRVSFAPEVTLHKIDLIPQANSPQQRQPRRRETIAFVPQSSQGSSAVTSPQRKKDDFYGEEIIFDSSDVEMEDDSHVYSSPRRALAFKIHEDDVTTEMSISRVEENEDQEEDTMEMTRPLGNIQLLNGSFQQQPDQQQQDLSVPLTQETVPLLSSLPLQTSTQRDSQDTTRPFGAITSLFLDDDDYESEETEMELTEQLPQQTAPVEFDQETDHTQVEAHMDISMAELTGDEESMVETTLMETSIDVSLVEGSIEEAMDLTSMADGNGTNDRLTIHNTLLNRQLYISSEREVTMDMYQTSAVELIMPRAGNDHQGEEISMDETHMFSTKIQSVTPVKKSVAPLKPAKSHTPVKRSGATPLKAIRSHTSETGSPMSLKRKNVNDDDVTMDLRERINSMSPKKKRSSKQILQNSQHTLQQLHAPIIPFEPVSQVLSSQIGSQEELKSSFTPLRSSKNASRKSIMSSGKIEFALTGEKIPLAPSHEQNDVILEEQEVYSPVSLHQFLKDLSIEFFDDLNVNEDFTAEIEPLRDSNSATPLDFTIAKSVKIPWLELYSFSCDELQKNMNELKLLFDNLNDEFAEENPRMVREYYETASLVQQKKLGDHLIEMKQFSDYQAEKSWYSWREKLLDELQIRLDKSMESLHDDCNVLSESVDQLNGLQATLDEENLAMERKIAELKAKKQTLESSERESLIQHRTDLLQQVTELVQETEQLTKLDSEMKQTEENVIDSTIIEDGIVLKNAYIEKHSQDPLSRLLKLVKSFQILENICGLRFHSLKGSLLVLSLETPKLRVEVDLLTESKNITLSTGYSQLTLKYLNKFIKDSESSKLSQFLSGITCVYESLKKFEEDISEIGAYWPCTMHVLDDGVQVNLKAFNKSLKYKCEVVMKFNDESMMTSCMPTSTNISLKYGTVEVAKVLQVLKARVTSRCFLQRLNDVTTV